MMKYFLIPIILALTVSKANAQQGFGFAGQQQQGNNQQGTMFGGAGLQNNQFQTMNIPNPIGLYNVENIIRFSFPAHFPIRRRGIR